MFAYVHGNYNYQVATNAYIKVSALSYDWIVYNKSFTVMKTQDILFIIMMVHKWAVINMREEEDIWKQNGERGVMQHTITGIPNFVCHVL